MLTKVVKSNWKLKQKCIEECEIQIQLLIY